MNRRLLIISLGLLLIGCQKRVEQAATVFQSDDNEYVLTIVLDMSGSFRELMAEDGKAWSFVCQVIDKYFRDRVGRNDKLILAQLSATDRSLLWYGTPLQLRQEFKSGRAFRDWLISKSDPNGSRVHEGIVQTVEYTLNNSSVANGKAKSAVFILSDLIDSAPGGEANRDQAVNVLAQLGKSGGVVGLYYVDVRLCSMWQRLLSDAGIPAKNLHIEADIVGHPTLPSFE